MKVLPIIANDKLPSIALVIDQLQHDATADSSIFNGVANHIS